MKQSGVSLQTVLLAKGPGHHPGPFCVHGRDFSAAASLSHGGPPVRIISSRLFLLRCSQAHHPIGTGFQPGQPQRHFSGQRKPPPAMGNRKHLNG